MGVLNKNGCMLLDEISLQVPIYCQQVYSPLCPSFPQALHFIWALCCLRLRAAGVGLEAEEGDGWD